MNIGFVDLKEFCYMMVIFPVLHCKNTIENWQEDSPVRRATNTAIAVAVAPLVAPSFFATISLMALLNYRDIEYRNVGTSEH